MSENIDNNTKSNKSKKPRTIFFKIIKYISIGIGSIILLLLIFTGWIYFSLFAGPEAMDMNEYHPFKSMEAKTEFLEFEEKLAEKWPVISDEKTVTTSYGKTFMRVSGPIDGQPLVLLPGGGSSSLIWQANIKAFSSVYRTYALDNIYDFGRSVYTQKMETHDDFTKWLDELFDTLSLGNNIRIAGYSYGGWVSGNYAVNHSERLSRVILIAPAFSIQPITEEFIWDMILGILPCKYTKQLSLYSVWSDLLLSGEEGKGIVDERIEYVNMAMKSFKFKMGVEPNMLTDAELNKLTTPVLFLIGENDKVCNPHDAINRLNELVPEVKTKLFLNTGHDLMFTHTDEVNNTILGFLE